MNRYIGFTLIEVLVALAILVSLTAIGVPSLIDFTVKLKVDNEISHLYRLLLSARNAAINTGKSTTVCPLNDANYCTNDWARSIYVFTDSNDNKRFEPNNNEHIIVMKGAIDEQDKLQYGKNRVGVTYAATGYLSKWGQNGTFKYCPKNHANHSRGIIVATSGRLYKSYQSQTGKHQGKDKNRSGKIILCD
ncbi:GspH/FimT family pseudopilin [Colwellia sp. 1_MG-2023]|uniref:GspH/FimT family pseudopilin n=1 Tax=Colwellia sp. 1_MG-2023 TaxID=3062649 RepID=UPI0026E29855|nr:GspH/FimT family pseudopilin [Colwellia sp. 1_MG-2023]MDO6446496.1 GspH/FimT family pseudopilin [Colwellia sp. 1_MG-2023]